MVEKYTVHWTARAKQRLQPIFNYIANVESIERANYVIDKIIEAGDSVANFPNKHTKEPCINKENVRFTVKWSYKIVFEIKENTIRILSVFHTSQSPEKIKNKL